MVRAVFTSRVGSSAIIVDTGPARQMIARAAAVDGNGLALVLVSVLVLMSHGAFVDWRRRSSEHDLRCTECPCIQC